MRRAADLSPEPTPARRTPAPTPDIDIRRALGNRAMAGLVQRTRKQKRNRRAEKKRELVAVGVLAGVEGDLGEGDHPLAVQGVAGPFDRTFETARLFWRSDSRTLETIRATGFSPRAPAVPANEIKWRSGENLDDVEPDTAVCVATDVRGAAFFPFTGPDVYLYAVALTSVTDTEAAQRQAQKAATGSGKLRPGKYDPADEDPEGQSAIWQFGERAAHRIEAEEILMVATVNRQELVPGHTPAGIRFAIGDVTWVPAAVKQFPDAAAEAKKVIAEHGGWYPRRHDEYLSYQGVIRVVGRHFPTSREEAAAMFKKGEIKQVTKKA